MFEGNLKAKKAERRSQRTQVVVADFDVAKKHADRIDTTLKSLLVDKRYAEILKIISGSIFASKDSQLAACASYLVIKLKSEEALQFIAFIKNNDLRTALYRVAMLGVSRQLVGSSKRINVRGSNTNSTQEIHKKLDEAIERITNIQDPKDRDIAYEAFIIAGRYTLGYYDIHSKLLSTAENIEDETAHDKLVAWYVLSTPNLPEVFNQGIASIRNSFERDLLLIDLGVKLSERILDLRGESSTVPEVMRLFDQSHPYDIKITEYRDAALVQIINRLLDLMSANYIPVYITQLLSKIDSHEIRERMVHEIVRIFKAKLRKAKKEFSLIIRDSWSKSYKKDIEDDLKDYVKNLQTILRNIVGEGLITNKKLIEQIESEMSSGFFSRGGLAA